MRENIQVPGESSLEVGVAGKKTAETLFAVEKLCDALDLYKEEKEKELEYQRKCKLENKTLPKPAVNLLFEALKVTTPEDYLLETLKSIKSSELHESLLVLPFSYVMRIMPVLCDLTEAKQEPELISNCLFFLLRVHAGQIVSNDLFQRVLERVNDTAVPQLKDLKDVMGYNLVGLKFLQQVMESGSSEIFRDAIKRNKTKKKSKKALLVIKS